MSCSLYEIIINDFVNAGNIVNNAVAIVTIKAVLLIQIIVDIETFVAADGLIGGAVIVADIVVVVIKVIVIVIINAVINYVASWRY